MVEVPDIDNNRSGAVVRRLVVPVAVTLAIVLVALVVFVDRAARGQDQLAAEASEQLVRSVFARFERDLGRLVFDYSWWDEPIRNVVETFDLAWADSNIGTYVADTHGISESFLVSANGETLFAYAHGEVQREDAFDYFGPKLEMLVREARAAPMEKPEPVWGYFLRNGVIHLVAANALTHEVPTGAQLRRHPRPVLIYSRHVNEELLAEISESFGVSELALVTEPPAAGEGLRAQVLRCADMSPTAWLVWRPPQPGSDLFRAILPWLAAGVLAIVVLGFVFVRAVVGTVRDMERDWRELAAKDRQLAQASKLAVLGEMAAGVVHELNQPLNIIRMATDSTRVKLREGDASVDVAAIDSQLEMIGGQSRRMSDTIEGMRMFSRDDYGRKRAFDPCESVERVAGWVRADLEERGISLDIDVPQPCGRVFGEPARFEQVILNLLINARDAVAGQFGGGGGTPAASGRVSVRIEDSPDKGTVAAVVADNGGGIASEHLERLFEPFFTTKEPGQGTGLGLSVSYGIVSAMNGALTAHNAAAGAEFRMVFPRIAPNDEASGTVSSP